MNLLERIKMQNGMKMLFIFGIFLIVIGTVLLVPKAFASLVPVSSVTITSEKLDYTKKDPGSYNIDKSASWIAKGKARITFDVDTVIRAEDKHRDVILVLDISGSMFGDKLTRLKQDSIDLINNLLSDSNNKAALITFETESQLVLSLTNNKDELTSAIDHLTTTGNTNYYQPLLNVDKILKDYKKEANRDCIVLFLTDGYPNEDKPNEVGQYEYLKKQYPYLTINGVQYEMGSDVLEPIKKVSDQQFIADMTDLNNVLFEASVAPITYDSFQIIDYINDDYFEIDSVDSITSTTGTYSLEYEGKVPKVIWNIDTFRSGTSAKLTIDVNLKQGYLNTGGIYPTNKKEEIKTEIDKVKEDITSSKTPVLADNYRVIYDGNAPVGSTAKNIPETTTRRVFDTVEISNQSAVCEGYQFKGWTITTKNVKKINDNYFEMPSSDVVLRASWGKIDISKNIDGEVYVAPPPIIKKVTDKQNTELWKYKSSITKIVFENNTLDKDDAIETFDISALKNRSVIAHIVPNNNTKTYTAYIQADGNIQANADSSYLFNSFSKLVSIGGLEYFDTSNVENMESMFSNCRELITLELDRFNTSNVTNMASIFYNCEHLKTLNVSNFNTSKVTNMEYMFGECKNLIQLDVSNFDTSQVTIMDRMFYYCNKLVDLDVSHFDTSNVIYMSGMFDNCQVLTNLNLKNFNTSKVTTMSSMFNGCSSLTSLDLSSFRTSKVTTMSGMFDGCRSLTTLDIGNFDTSNVTNMFYMFYGCNTLTSIDVSHFDTSKVTNMNGMFRACSNLIDLGVRSFATSKVTDMQYMFSGCSNLTSLNVSNFDTSNVTTMEDMFYGCTNLVSLDLSSFNTSKVTNMNGMFRSCSNLIDLDVSSFDTNQVRNMSWMFYDCHSLTSLDLSSFRTSNVTEMYNMFSNCSGLTSLDLSHFDTSNVTSMREMFRECSNLINLDVSNFNVNQVTNMYYMFYGCVKLQNLDLSSFGTSKVTDVQGMFYECSGLTNLNISRFDTSNVTSMYAMFYGCSSLTSLDVSSFRTGKVTNMNYVFYNCNSLTNLDLSQFDTSNVTGMLSMFRNCSNITTTITIMNTSLNKYSQMFENSATSTDSKITVNYIEGTSDLVDKMLDTKSTNSNIIKGNLVS